MIIVSQNRKVIINFNTSTAIYIKMPVNKNKDEYVITVSSGIVESTIGLNGTEERAKEVLKEISERIVLSKRFEATRIQEGQINMMKNMYDGEKQLFEYIMPEK